MEKIHYFRPLYLALALTISLFSTASTPNRYKTSASLPDSLLTEQHIRSIYYTLPDSALSLLDEAEARRLPHLPQFRIDMLRGTVYERQGMYHLKERYIRRALQSDSVQHTPLRKLQVLTQLATALDRLNKYEEGIRICTEAIELAQEQGQKAKESELLFTLGRMYQGMKLDDKAFRYMYRSIELLQGTDNVRELAQLSTSYGDLSAYLAENERLDEAIALCEKRLDVISRMSLLPGPPPGYIDQQYGYLYSKLAWYYLQNGQSEKAAETARKYQSTGFAQSQAGQTEIVPYLLGTRQYHKVLQLLDASSALAEPADTFNYGHLILLDRYARTYRGLKRPELADSYQQRTRIRHHLPNPGKGCADTRSPTQAGTATRTVHHHQLHRHPARHPAMGKAPPPAPHPRTQPDSRPPDRRASGTERRTAQGIPPAAASPGRCP